MKKRFIFFALFTMSGLWASAQNVDSVSVYLLKRMETSINGLKSFSMQVTTTYDVNTESHGLVKYNEDAAIRILRPDKMTVERRGDDGRQLIVYNGKLIQLYNRTSNTYAKLAIKGSVIEVVDSLNRSYGIVFPAADILYPNFVSDVMATVTRLSYLGVTQIDGKDCFHIAAVTPEQSWQIWISDDVKNLPVRLVIVYTKADGSPQFQADYYDWELNETDNPAMFEFTPVTGVREVPLKSSLKN